MSSLGVRAFQAAQEAKTFRDAIDSVKDATSTGWMNIFEKLFGNYEEAKVVWTDLANTLYDIFAGPLEVINEILGRWKQVGAQTQFINSFREAYRYLSDIGSVISDAWHDIMPELTAEDLAEFTNKIYKALSAAQLSEDTAQHIYDAMANIFTILKTIGNLYKTVFKAGIKVAKPILNLLKNLFFRFTDLTTSIISIAEGSGLISTVFEDILIIGDKLAASFNRIFGSKKLLDRSGMAASAAKIATKFSEIIDKIKLTDEKAGKLETAFDKVWTVVDKIAGTFQTIFNIGKDILEKVVNKIFGIVDIDNLNTDWETFKGKIASIRDRITEAANALVIYATNTEAAAQASYNIDVERATRWIETFRENHPLIMSMVDGLKSIFDRVVEIGNRIIDWGLDRLDEITFANLFKVLSLLLAFKLGGGILDILSLIPRLLISISDIFSQSAIETIGNAVKSMGIGVLAIAGAIWLIADIDTAKLDKAVETVGAFLGYLALIAALIGGIVGIVELVEKRKSEGSEMAALAKVILNIGIAIALMAGSMWILAATLDKYGNTAFGQAAGLLVGFLIAIGVFLGEAIAIAAVSKEGSNAFAGLGLVMVGIGYIVGKIAAGIIKIAKLEPDEQKNVLKAAASLLIAFVGFALVVFAAGATGLTKNAGKGAAAIGGAMLAIAITFAIMARVLNKSTIGWIAAGLGMAVGVMVLLAVLFKLLQSSGNSALAALGISVAIIAVAGAIALIALAMKQLDGIKISGSVIASLAIVMGVIALIAGFAAFVPGAGLMIVAALAGIALALAGLGLAIYLVSTGIATLTTAFVSAMEAADPEKMATVFSVLSTGLNKLALSLALIGIVLMITGSGFVMVGLAALEFGIGIGIAALGIAALIQSFTNLLTALDSVGEGVRTWAQSTIDIFSGIVNGIKTVANGIGKGINWIKGLFTGEKDSTEELTDADLELLDAERKRQTLGPKALALNEKFAKSSKDTAEATKEVSEATKEAAHEQKTYEEFLAMSSDEQKKYLETASDEELKALDAAATAEKKAARGTALDTMLGIFGLKDAETSGADIGSAFAGGFLGGAENSTAEMYGIFSLGDMYGGIESAEESGEESGDAFANGFLGKVTGIMNSDDVKGMFGDIGGGMLDGMGLGGIASALSGGVTNALADSTMPSFQEAIAVQEDATVNHEVSGTIRVEGVNDEDDVVAVKDIIAEDLVKDRRRTITPVWAK